MKIYSFLCIFGSVFTASDDNRRWNIIDEANDRKESIEKNTLQSMENSFAIENLEITANRQSVLNYEQSKLLLELKKVLAEQNTLIEALSNDLIQTRLQLNATEKRLDALQNDFDGNDYDPCLRTCSQSLEGKTEWKTDVSFFLNLQNKLIIRSKINIFQIIMLLLG